MLIRTPGGKVVLVDGGPDPLGPARLFGAKLPFWKRTVDLVVLTHPHADHATGLIEVLGRYDVEHILEREQPYDGSVYVEWRQAVAAEGAVVIEARSGQVVDLSDGAYVEVLGPPKDLLHNTASDVDNASVVLRLVYGDVAFLLTGDMFHESESALVDAGIDVESDVLKVAHHGSRSSSTGPFLNRVRPAVAVISAGQDNRYGHPHQETIDALRQHIPEDRILQTKDSGDIEFVTDGTSLKVKTER